MNKIAFLIIVLGLGLRLCSQTDQPSSQILRVEFHKTLTQSEFNKLKDDDIEVLEYIGNHIYIIDDKKHRISKHQFMIQNYRSVISSEKFIRFHPSLYKDRYQNFIVSVYRSREISDIIQSLGDIKVLHYDSSDRQFYIRANEKELELIAHLSSVQYIEIDDYRPELDGLLDLGNKRSTSISLSPNYGLQLNGSGINIGIQDDGNVNDHVDFHGRLMVNVPENHGAHADLCSGTIIAAGNRDPLGMGAAWGSNLYVFKYFNYPLFNNSTIAQLYTQDQVFITSTSLSDGCNKGYVTQSRNIDDQIRSRGSLMHVISAGNNGDKNCGYGAGNFWGTITGGHKTAKNCITVGSVTSYDVMSGFSSRGPAKDGRLKPEVCADGVEIFTTGNRDNYNLAKGTSQSAPGVAGILAQLYQGYKDKTGSNAPSALIKAALMNGCEDLHHNGPDYRTGYGRVNAWRSWKMIDLGHYFHNSVAQGDSNIHTITLPSNVKSLRVMLYWHDKEAALNVSKDLVNDIDMRLVHPSGTLLPWKLDPTPNSNTIDNPAVRDYDRLNNHEQVTTANPPSGNYQIIVKGHDIPMGSQPYVVVYEVLLDEIQLVYPAGGEALIPGIEHTFRWDASHNSGSFRLEISDTSGTSWTTIDNNIAGDKRWYNYTIPAGAKNSGLYRCRISRNGIVDTSNPFTIMYRPSNIRLDWVCADSAKISWDSVQGANQYKVFKLGAKYMDSIAVTSNTFYIAKGLSSLNEDWFSAQAIGANNALSYRGYAVKKERGMYNCGSQVDIKLDQVISPEGNIYSCLNRDSLKIVIRIVNNGMTITSLPIFYYLNKNSLVSDTINQTIAINSDHTITLTKTISARSSGFDSIMIWCAHPLDAYRLNDTLRFRWNNFNASNINIPYQEDFEIYNDADSAFECNTDYIFPLPWMNEPNDIIDNMDWRVRSGSTPSPDSGPNGDTTTTAANGKYAFVQSGNCDDFIAKLNLGCINLDTAKNPYLNYFYSMNGNNMGEHRLEVFAHGKWNLDTLPRINGHQGSAWKQQRVDLTPYRGQKIMIRWTAKVKGELGSDIAIDRVSIRDSIIMDTIALIVNPILGGSVIGTGVYSRGATVTVIANTNAGYTFSNWTENGTIVSTSPSYTFTISGNRNLTANFNQIVVNDTVRSSINPILGGNVSGTGIYARGATVTVIANTNAGFIFSNWTENGTIVSTSPSYTFMISGNRNLTANFIQNQVNYTVTTIADPSLGGNVLGSGIYANNSNVTVSANANNGYVFINWKENGIVVSTNSTYQFNINSHRNLTAHFNNNVSSLAQNYQSDIQMYPNPANSVLNIRSQLPIEELFITDILGKNIIPRVKISGIRSHMININDIAAGVYFVFIKTSDNFTKMKLVVEK